MEQEEAHPVQWYVIVNPAAAQGRAGRRWARTERRLRTVLALGEVVFTRERGEAARLARQAIERGYRYLVAVGGDGTNHEVINGIMEQTAVPSSLVCYALLPVGTGNDWRRTFGIPRRLSAWLKMMKNRQTLLQDVGLVRYYQDSQPRTRYFINVAGLAYDAFVVRQAATLRPWLVSPLIYPFLILRFLFQYRPGRASVRFDNQRIDDYFYTINAGIGRYSGGGMQLTPHAAASDGLLALTVARRLSRLSIVLNTWRFYTGTIGGHSKVSLFQLDTFTVEPLDDQDLLLEADGEFLGQAPAIFQVIPQALQIVVPRR